MPTRAVAGRGFFARNRFLLLVVLLTVVFAGVAVGVVLLRQNPGLITAPTTQAAGLLETTEDPTPTPTPSPTVSLTPVITSTVVGGFRPFLPTTDLTRQACPKPEGWVTYTVKPTDSLVRLSMVYGVTLEVLLKANCMTEDTLVKSGERIYVPGMTPTPTFTITPTPTRTRKYIPPTSTPPPYNPPPATNTPVIITAPPPTEPPPTPPA